MEQNKLDNEFRKKLNERTINPSPMAWDRLDAMLSVAEEKKQPKKRTWMYVAASFLGFLLVGTMFLKQGSDKGNNTVVKDADAVVVAPLTKESNSNASSIQATVTEVPANIQNQPVQLAEVKQKRKSQKATTATKAIKAETPVIIQPQEAVAENIINDKQLIANDADQLLDNAMAKNQGVAKKSIKIDSKSLLSSVEGELDQSFKEKAFQGAVRNFNTIKTSVANRNHK